MVSIHRPLGYGPNTLPLRQDAIEPFYIVLGIKAPTGFEPVYSGYLDHPLYLLRIELKINRRYQVSILRPYIMLRIKAHAGTAPAPPVTTG